MARLARPSLIRALLWAAVFAYGVGFAVLSVLKHRAFETGRFDLGNMTQAVWSTAHGRPLEVTDLSGEQVVRLGSHVDPILVLFAPLWWVWPDPSLLLVVQALAVALGAIPLFSLARTHLRSERAALGFAVAYLLYPATQWMTLSEFHPVALATPLLLFAIRALDEDRLVVFGVTAAAAIATKEHVALCVAGLGVWYALARGRRRAGAAIAALAVAWATIAVAVIVPAFNANGASDFFGRYDDVGGSPAGIVRTAFTDPLAIAAAITEGRDAAFVAKLLLPLLALPLAAPAILVAAAPELALDLLSETRTQTSIHFHYAATIIPVLFAAAVWAAKRVRRRWLPGALVAGVVAANYLLGALPFWTPLPGAESLHAGTWRVREHDRVAERALALIPPTAAVSASNSLGGHLSERRRVFSFPVLAEATWIAVDYEKPSFRDKVPAPIEFGAAIARIRAEGRWRVVFDEDGVLILKLQSHRVAPNRE